MRLFSGNYKWEMGNEKCHARSGEAGRRFFKNTVCLDNTKYSANLSHKQRAK